MKKFQTLGKSLTKDQQKKVMGGDETVPGGGTSCNNFCTADTDCTDTCTKCNPMAGWDKKVCERPS